MDSRLIIGVTWLVVLATVHDASLAAMSAADKARVETSIAIGEKIGEAMKEQNFNKLIQNIGVKMAPFFGALGPIFSLMLSSIPSGPTLEEKLMKRFDEMDRQFDRIDSKFGQVMQMIKWENMQVKMADEEQSIRYLHELYRSVMTAPVNEKESNKNYFLSQYESDYQGAGYKLYDAAVSNDATTFKNVFQGCKEFMANDRQAVETFMIGYFGLVMKAMILQMAYYKWAPNHQLTESRTTIWLNRMERLKQEMVKVDNEIISGYEKQLSKDMDEFIAMNSNLDNKAVADQLYAKLSTKYFWRYWMVLVSKDIDGSTRHWHGHVCGGSTKFRKHGKKVVAASVDKAHSGFNAATANSEIGRLGTLMKTKRKRPDAKYLFTSVQAGLKNSCKPFAYIAFICGDCDANLEVRAAPGHMVSKKVTWQYYNKISKMSFFSFSFGHVPPYQLWRHEMNAVFFG